MSLNFADFGLGPLSRRGMLSLGALGAAALSWNTVGTPRLARADDSSAELPGFGRAKRVLLMFMWGGPSHIDTWDPKPTAPDIVRGEFKPIATNVPGIEISELFPRLAQRTDQLAIVRSMSHGEVAHLSSVHRLTTGHFAPRINSDAEPPSRRDAPHFGSLISRLRPPGHGIPACVTMPWNVYHPAAPGGVAPGQHSGWLGSMYDPMLIQGDPNAAGFKVPGLALGDDISPERFSRRQRLLESVNAGPGAAGMPDSLSDLEVTRSFADFQSQAGEFLASGRLRGAFDLELEAPENRDRYGRNIHGQCLLLARRLLEVDVPVVCVNWHNDGQNFWDTHGDNFNRLKNHLCPPSDQGFSALIDDLQARQMLDDTLVVWVGEFGRRPQITAQNAGREHWSQCYSAVLCGGGIRGGQVYGRSDRLGAYPVEGRVSPSDLTATIHHALGMPRDLVLHDSLNRPHSLVDGEPITALF